MTEKFKFNASLLEFGEVNSGFMRIKLSVMSEEIANKTHFIKEVIDKRLNGLNYIPVVLEYKEEVKDAGTHGGQLIIDDNGISYLETTKPYGCVIANTAKWEDIKQQNGETIPYVTCEAYLWADRYDVSFINNGGTNNQSMEINLLQKHYNEELDCVEVDDFEFSALTILGKTVKPAFPSARVITDYSKQDFEAEYNEMVKALSIYLNKEKEGQNLDEKLELLSKFNLTVEELDFSIDDFELEELENKLKEFSENKNLDTEPNKEPEKLDFSATYRQKYDALREAVSTKNDVKRDEDGNRIEEYWYWVEDFDDEYVYTEQNHWTEDSYDDTVIRFSYTFNQTDLTATVGDDPIEMIMTLLTKEEHDKIQADRVSAEANFTELQTKYNSLLEESNQLIEFKNEKIKEQKEAVLQDFTSKLDVEELSTIDIDNLTIEQIEEKCFALIGKKQAQFSKEEKPNKKVTINFNHTKTSSDWLSVLADETRK